jgi:hypothetical protein
LKLENRELLAEVERLRKASVPICVGQPIIQILAEHGQWQSESGAAVIAADGLFRNDPYKELTSLRLKVKAAEGMAGALEFSKLEIQQHRNGWGNTLLLDINDALATWHGANKL